MKQTLYTLFIVLMSTSAFAQITNYTDRVLWEADATNICATEDFEGFTVDTEFRTAAIQMNGFTLEELGVGFDFRNLVEVLPLDGSDNNGTNHASMYTNKDAPITEVMMTLDEPAWGFFADFNGVAGNEILALMYNTSGGMIGSHTFSMNNTSFGFISATESFSSIKFMSANIIPRSSGEGFSMDNVALTCAPIIPSMGQWALMILALLLSSIGVGYLLEMNRKAIAIRS